MKKILLFLGFLMTCVWATAQMTGGGMGNHDMTGMRANGKIYVVMTVVITIITGLLLYLINLDRKISKIEKQNP